jgi:hypothetical protein
MRAGPTAGSLALRRAPRAPVEVRDLVARDTGDEAPEVLGIGRKAGRARAAVLLMTGSSLARMAV